MISSHRWPRIVAESLGDVAEPLTTVGGSAESVDVRDVLRLLDARLAPGRDGAVPPPFLYPSQHDAWRRASYALTHWGGAMLAEPVGSGKSWIALAVALNERTPALVVAPAILLDQWRGVADDAGVSISLWSHERLSRGSFPPRWPPLVIVDESHRFRSPGIRRVRNLAPYLVGRRTLLITATPIVNRVRDLVEQLRLIVPDDALSLDGIPSLGLLESCEDRPRAIRRLVIRGRPAALGSPRIDRTLPPSDADCARAATAIAVIGTLKLSENPGVQRLMRSVFLDAACSSDAAFHASLKRYRALLLQARDGGQVSRSALRQLAGPDLGQLVMWELIDREEDPGLLLDDLPTIERALSAPTADAEWMAELAVHLTDGVPVVCFARHRATAHLLRGALGDATAWVTGEAAGIGPHRVPRNVVLDAFGPHRGQWNARRTPPVILIATDVAAEGLNLQAAGRIVHLDLPWTAMRMDQREGRLLRFGQHNSTVEVVVRRPPPEIERHLRPLHRVTRKRRLTQKWIEVLEGPDCEFPADARHAVVAGVTDARAPADLVLVALSCGSRSGVRLLARTAYGEWSDQDAVISGLLERARQATPVSLQGSELREPATTALRAVLGINGCPHREQSALIARIQRLAREAARRRDGSGVATLDRMLAFAATAQPLGGRLLLERWRTLPDRDLLRAIVPPAQRIGPIAARIAAAILFRSTVASLR
ncbi:MAG: DEAD/DEAH box helicase [Gemmatimonadota bacterium]